MYSVSGPVTKVIGAILFGLLAFIVLVATNTIADPGLMP
jgi:hypothetical protein